MAPVNRRAFLQLSALGVAGLIAGGRPAPAEVVYYGGVAEIGPGRQFATVGAWLESLPADLRTSGQHVAHVYQSFDLRQAYPPFVLVNAPAASASRAELARGAVRLSPAPGHAWND